MTGIRYSQIPPSLFISLEPTLVALEGLKELGEGLRGELLVVLGGHLDADLQVLPDVGRQHGPQALQGVLHRQGAEEVHQPLEGEGERTG